jgi:hypothetical protein
MVLKRQPLSPWVTRLTAVLVSKFVRHVRSVLRIRSWDATERQALNPPMKPVPSKETRPICHWDLGLNDGAVLTRQEVRNIIVFRGGLKHARAAWTERVS